MKNILICIIIITFVIANSKKDEIGFRYGLLSKSSHDSDSLIILSDSSIIHTDDLIRINIGYKNNTNLCIAYKDAEGRYMSLFSSDDEKYLKQDTLYVNPLPWTQINPPVGPETFYFINSNESLSDLNTMLTRYERAPPKGQSKLALRIQDKINSYDPDVQDNMSRFTRVLDKPVGSGVTFRGKDNVLKDISLTNECFGTGGIAFIKIVLIHK